MLPFSVNNILQKKTLEEIKRLEKVKNSEEKAGTLW